MRVLPFLRFFFYCLPRLMFHIAGLFRIFNRGKRAFRNALEKEGLLDEVVEELIKDFTPSMPFRETLFRFSRR